MRVRFPNVSSCLCAGPATQTAMRSRSGWKECRDAAKVPQTCVMHPLSLATTSECRACLSQMATTSLHHHGGWLALYGQGVRDFSQRSPKGGKLLPICCILCAPAVSHSAAENPKVQTCRESTSSLEAIFFWGSFGGVCGRSKNKSKSARLKKLDKF